MSPTSNIRWSTTARLAAFALAGWLGALPGRVTAQTAEELRLWRSPEFQRAFLGTYGVRTDIEPQLTEAERALMQQIMELMGQPRGLDKARVAILKTITPASSAAFDFTLGNIYFQQDKLDKAATAYQRAIQKFPAFQRAWKNLGIVEIRAGRHAAGREALARAIELGATDGLTYGLLGVALAAEDKFMAAETAFRQAMLLQPDVPDWKLGLARAMFRQNRFGEVAALADELIAKNPESADFYLLKAGALLGLKQPLKAAEIYEFLDLDGRAPATALQTLGDIYVNEGAWDLAAGAYRRSAEKEGPAAAERTVRNVEVLAARGAADAASDLIAFARERFGDALGENGRIRLLRVEARLASGEGGENYRRILEEIIRVDPLDGDALIRLGQLAAKEGRLEQAVLYFERAAALDRFEAEAKLRHAQALVRNGRFQEAVPLLKRSQELRPREDVARYLEQVERLARTQAAPAG
ncbi:MAG: tetratricopeptide repeat protein [Kiritimatiellae bacterium]|nr:tetratricopeptide repeat protein [Kiritimatiellia bacterium]MDW8457699.1 tetratricopeptide repeat protein [Verrucomicrobiota bacterium]